MYAIQGGECYIAELYVRPEKRFTPELTKLIDEVTEIARLSGCMKLYSHVIPSNKNATQSLKVILKYGFNLVSVSTNLIRLEKGLL